MMKILPKKYHLKLLFLICIVAAASFIYGKNNALGPASLELLRFRPAKQPKTLTADDVKEDIKYLIYALDNAYIGKLTQEKAYDRMISEFQKISNNQTSEVSVEKFLKVVNKTLTIMPDGHLIGSVVDVNLENEVHACQPPSRALASNVASNYRFIRKAKKSIMLMKIPTFQGEADDLSERYVTPISDNLQIADAIILDLRGNSGGLITTSLAIASALWGEQHRPDNYVQYFPMPIKKAQSIRTPASYALEKNQSIMSGSSYGDWLIENYKKSLLTKILEFNEYAQNGYKRPLKFNEYDFPDQSEVENNDIVYDWENITERIYKRPVFLIIDSGCMSACEKLVEALEAHPYVKTIGSRTAGAVQFGNITTLVLPKSMIGISVATSYVQYKDDRQVERFGYEPQISVPYDSDPVDIALGLIK